MNESGGTDMVISFQGNMRDKTRSPVSIYCNSRYRGEVMQVEKTVIRGDRPSVPAENSLVCAAEQIMSLV